MLNLTKFAGEIPKVASRLLPDNAAQIAKNCKLLNGNIVPMRYPGDYRILAPGNTMFYKKGSQWFEWNKIVDIASAPIADNRFYFTGDGVPKLVQDSSVVYPLKVASPQTALTAAVTGTPDPLTEETILYSYTYVTTYDEESQPAPVSNAIVRSSGMNVTLTGFVTPPTDRNYNRIRIYRSKTSATGETNLYFIKEVVLPVPNPSFIDVVEDNAIQEIIPSINYDPPPDGLSGIISLPNGMLAGFVGNKLYFSEPYIPHAWPTKYVLTTNFDIVGLGAFVHSIAVMTTGNPYIATGISPDAMVMEIIEVNHPCINKKGIVDLGQSVIYPCPDGLVSISSNGASLVTRDIFTRDQWQELSPDTMIAAQFNGRYIASYSYVDVDNITQKGTLIVDLTGELPFISRTDTYSNYMFYEIGAGRLFILNGSVVQEWDSGKQPFMNMTWRSKPFILNGDTNFGCLLVDGEAPTLNYADATFLPLATIEDSTFVIASFASTVISGSSTSTQSATSFQAKVYADGVLRRTVTDINKVSRLPGGFLSRKWEIEITGQYIVSAIYLTQSPSDLYVGTA